MPHVSLPLGRALLAGSAAVQATQAGADSAGYLYRFPSSAVLPVDAPVVSPPSTPGGGDHLAATGLGVGLPLGAVLLLVLAVVLRRRLALRR